MKGKVLVILLSGLVVAGLTGCRLNSPAMVYDSEGFLAVTAYIYDIKPAIRAAKFDLDEYARDFTNLERLGWLEHDVEIILKINQRHLTDDFPDYDSIKAWTIPVIRDDHEWVIYGPDLAMTDNEIVLASRQLVDVLSGIVEAAGDIDEDDWVQANKVVVTALGAVEDLQRLFANQ